MNPFSLAPKNAGNSVTSLAAPASTTGSKGVGGISAEDARNPSRLLVDDLDDAYLPGIALNVGTSARWYSCPRATLVWISYSHEIAKYLDPSSRYWGCVGFECNSPTRRITGRYPVHLAELIYTNQAERIIDKRTEQT